MGRKELIAREFLKKKNIEKTNGQERKKEKDSPEGEFPKRKDIKKENPSGQ
jgi:hypothetical protein